uniref:ribosomal protein L2 n=1 Tax=Zygnema cf. cylindricum TaxID=3142258 RepID=UPI0031F47046
MKQFYWTGKTLKQLSLSTKYTKAGRNSSGSITMFHRGGGSTRLLRRIDFKRNVLMTGFVERIEYDPNRSARIALIRWSSSDKARALLQGAEWKRLTRSNNAVATETHGHLGPQRATEVALGALRSLQLISKVRSTAAEGPAFGEAFVDATKEHQTDKKHTVDNTGSNSSALFTYILACDQLKVGDNVMNLHLNSSVPQTEGASVSSTVLQASAAENSWEHEKLYQQVGNCIPLCNLPIGTFIHNIELHPGQGGKLVRAAGTFAQLVQKLPLGLRCLVRLPSGLSKPFDSRCRATIGIVSNPAHSTRKLTKAGQRRWLGKRPIVRGVAMNPIDHPHGGGEGRTKGGRPSVSPWGKPTKGGFKTVIRKHNK